MIEIAAALLAWLLITLALWADETARQGEARAQLGDVLNGWEVLPQCLV